MLRSYGTFSARVVAEAILMRASLAWGRSKPTCPLGIMIAVSLVFFGRTAEIASGDLDGRGH